MKQRHSGFTLIEVLITVTLIVALGGLGLTGVQMAREKARSVVEVNAARSLITAYLSHAADNNGKVLAGYQTDSNTTNIEGEPLHHPVNARYPWRLTPNVPKIEGVMLYNGNEKALKSDNRDYLVSAQPNLGLNATLVGGHFGSGSPLPPTPRLIEAYGKFYLSHLAESDDPSKLLVFASARSGEDQPGYFEVRPPKLTSSVWQSGKFKADSPAAAHGFVDFRWRGKAVAVMLGGNVEMLDETQLRDMRRWSHQAARANEANFTIRRAE
jgi:prepilin-type N-terminal cleavage/methylation domain-containing protein